MYRKQFLLKPLYAALILGLSGQVSAGGFGVTMQSATGAGNAATGHAMAEDASAMFYNPALLFSMEGRQINGGAALLSTDIKVTNTGTTSPAPIGSQIGALGDVTEPGGLSATPSFFYRGGDLKGDFAYGVGVNVPFGISSEYEKTDFVRYEATESALKTININPAFAYKISDQFQIGAGLNVQIGQATLGKAIDAHAACLSIAARSGGAISTATCATGGALGLSGAANASTDSSVTIDALGVGYGANLGMVYKPMAGTTFSVGLRSPVTLELEGEADFTHANLAGLGNVALTGAGLVDQDANSTLKMPASASVAAAHRVNDKLTLHGDITWTQWSSVPEIRITFPDHAISSPASDSVTDLQWEDTVRYGIGATYQLNDRIRLRGGIATDPTPTPGPGNRTPRAPSSDNHWFSVGASYQLNKHFTFDAGLSLIKPHDVSINYIAPGTAPYVTRADVDSDAFGAALSVNYRF